MGNRENPRWRYSYFYSMPHFFPVSQRPLSKAFSGQENCGKKSHQSSSPAQIPHSKILTPTATQNNRIRAGQRRFNGSWDHRERYCPSQKHRRSIDSFFRDAARSSIVGNNATLPIGGHIPEMTTDVPKRPRTSHSSKMLKNDFLLQKKCFQIF